jgi:hypothetical protein
MDMKTLARTFLIAFSCASTLATLLPAQADPGRGWEHREYREHGRAKHWRERCEHRPAYGPPVVIHRSPVVVYRPPLVIHESPVVYERRFYHGPTHYTPYYHESSVSFSFTLPLR